MRCRRHRHGIPPWRHHPAASEQAKLKAVIDQAPGGECAVEVVGLASTSGATTVNQALSAARAKVVMDALPAEASFTASTVEGLGETTQFGDDRRPTVVSRCNSRKDVAITVLWSRRHLPSSRDRLALTMGQ